MISPAVSSVWMAIFAGLIAAEVPSGHRVGPGRRLARALLPTTVVLTTLLPGYLMLAVPLVVVIALTAIDAGQAVRSKRSRLAGRFLCLVAPAVGLVAVTREHRTAALALVALTTTFEATRYLMGKGRPSPTEGLLSGMLAVVAASLIWIGWSEIFSPSPGPLLIGPSIALLAPLGQHLASRWGGRPARRSVGLSLAAFLVSAPVTALTYAVTRWH
jgi:hypothetical protein